MRRTGDGRDHLKRLGARRGQFLSQVLHSVGGLRHPVRNRIERTLAFSYRDRLGLLQNAVPHDFLIQLGQGSQLPFGRGMRQCVRFPVKVLGHVGQDFDALPWRAGLGQAQVTLHKAGQQGIGQRRTGRR